MAGFVFILKTEVRLHQAVGGDAHPRRIWIFESNHTNKNLEPADADSRFLVGVAGFEPAASWTRTMRDTKLRHTPITWLIIMNFPRIVKGKSRDFAVEI